MRPTCLAVISEDLIAIGFENSIVLILKVDGDKLIIVHEIDHKIESQSV